MASGGTSRLIGAGKVGGAPVHTLEGERLGVIEDVIPDKRSGCEVYVVVGFGGGERYRSLPWSALRYDLDLGGYRVDLDRDRQWDAPDWADGDWADGAWGQPVQDYCGARPYLDRVP